MLIQRYIFYLKHSCFPHKNAYKCFILIDSHLSSNCFSIYKIYEIILCMLIDCKPFQTIQTSLALSAACQPHNLTVGSSSLTRGTFLLLHCNCNFSKLSCVQCTFILEFAKLVILMICYDYCSNLLLQFQWSNNFYLTLHKYIHSEFLY